MDRYDIYLGTIQYRNCRDTRPLVLLGRPVVDPAQPESSTVTVVPVSSQLDLYDPRTDFLIAATHQDFPATGLRRDSYVIGANSPVRVSPPMLHRKLGALTGALRKEFIDWEGGC